MRLTFLQGLAAVPGIGALHGLAGRACRPVDPSEAFGER
jgi:hypothetical protein